MRYVKTIFNGLERDDSIAKMPIGQTEVIRLSDQDTLAYAPMVALIGSAFARASLMHQEMGMNEPQFLTIVMSETAESKYKEEDADTRLERVEWFLENSAPPPGGIVAQIYINEGMNRYLDTPFGFNTLWRTKTIWDRKKTGDYILLQPHGEIDHNKSRGGSRHRHENLMEQIDMVRELAQKHNIKIKEVDYTTGIDELYDLMLGCKTHFGYIGATHYIAAYTLTPTVALGKEMRNPKYPAIAYRHHSASSAPQQEVLEGWLGVWNNLGTPTGRTLTYDKTRDVIHQDEPRYYKMADPCNMEQTRLTVLSAFLDAYV